MLSTTPLLTSSQIITEMENVFDYAENKYDT